MKTIYVNLKEINALQEKIMLFIQVWVRTKKTPVPQKEIIKKMTEKGVKSFTTVWALNALLRKGYIRRATTLAQNKTFYIQLRTV